ncbi:MAG: hypothetical protein Q8P26_05195 [Candidatus Levybacteria bacterium]|nr:hypothetical protein [Candidatus Levybacteria bacterium]
MYKYKIYALIHGETLPEGKIFECEIKKMGFDEQAKRGFAPIQSIFSEGEMVDYHKTYVTSLRYVDPIKIKSEYVIICDIEEDKPGDALGGAIKIIDRITRFLSLACLEDVKRKFGRNRGSFEPYVYQVNKIYLLDKNGKESDVDYKLESGHMYLPNRPEQTEWRDSGTNQFLDEIYNFHDETLERALKYLYRSSIGYLVLDSKEKIALDHFKSIEIIVDSLSNKDTFKKRLKEVGNKIGITPEEENRIVDFHDERSKYGDVAHPSPFDEVERYPNQFPIPSNVRYSGGGFDSIAASIILKYFQYIKGIFIIEIDESSNHGGHEITEDTFSRVYTISLWGTTHHNELCFYTTEKDKNRLKGKLKTAFAKHYKIPEKSIVEITREPSENKGLKRKRFKLRINTEI